MPVPIHTSIILPALFVVISVFCSIKWYGARLRWVVGKDSKSPLSQQFNPPSDDKNPSGPSNQGVPGTQRDNHQAREIRLYKDLYFKLQNLERFPDILPQSRHLLISLFTETLADALKRPDPGILSLDQYSPESLSQFLHSENDQTTREWEEYVARRRGGAPAELFQDMKEAIWWLRQMAPVKYVDGAWLGHIHKITTPFALRRVTKDAWQVLSEELGDGDPHKNHVYVYRELMRKIGSVLPEPDSLDFIHPRHELDEICVWKAAVAQLLISLFPHEFLPEILGFNLHFEALTMETMKAAKELEELGLDAYYFILHISIDNADSGHTAIAMQSVVKYIEYVRQTQGASSAQQAWRRVQAGFILSKGLSAGPQCPSRSRPAISSFPRNLHEAEVIRVFKAKAPVAHKIHCSSRMRIGGRKLVDWLEPCAFAAAQWQMDFLDHLSNMKPWVHRGNSDKSKLIQELSWEGKMFGSFTQSEVEIVRRWIDALGNPNPQLYWLFVGRSETLSDHHLQNQDIRVDYPVLSPTSMTDPSAKLTPLNPSPLLLHVHPGAINPTNADMSKLLPLWFSTPCLLESFVCIPAKTTTVTASSIVRFLRAQSGFDAEGAVVAGMDEARRLDSAGIVELGLALVKASGFAEPASLQDVLETWPSDFALTILHLSMAPMANTGFLLGLAWAFVGLHDMMTRSPLLSSASQAALMQIVRRERDCLEICFDELKDDKSRCADFHRGYGAGRAEMAGCFGQDGVRS